MGGRQSSHATSRYENTGQGSSRYSTASLDNGSLLGQASGSFDLSSERPIARRRRRRDRNDQFIEAHSLPSHLFPFVTAEIKCPVCNKRIGTNEIETHLLACLAKPRVSYNEDVLNADAGECIICFDDMVSGEHIARLPCLCIYHKKCLDEWFSRNRCCPAHPDQVPQEYADSSAASNANIPATQDDEQDQAGSTNEENHSVSQTINILTRSDSHPYTENIDFPSQGSIDNIDAIEEPLPELDQSTSNEPHGGESSAVCSNAMTSSSPDAISPADDYSHSTVGREGKTIVHVDDGSIHGSPNLFDEEEIAQLASKIKTILVQESPRGRDYEET